jgi:hypothetical protein
VILNKKMKINFEEILVYFFRNIKNEGLNKISMVNINQSNKRLMNREKDLNE